MKVRNKYIKDCRVKERALKAKKNIRKVLVVEKKRLEKEKRVEKKSRKLKNF